MKTKTRANVLTTAGIVHLAAAALLTFTFLLGQPTAAPAVALGFTPTPSPEQTPPPPSTPPPSPSPHLVITKTADPTTLFPGDTVTFVIEVCNDGDAVAENVIVSDALPSELEVVSASTSQGRAVIVGNGVRGEFGDLIPGACATLTIVARVRLDVPPGTRLRNVGTIGDLVSNEVWLDIIGLLPESGGIAPATAAILLAVGIGLLAAGMVVRSRNQAS